MGKLLFTLAAALGAFALAEIAKEDGVLVLDDSNFEEALKAHDPLLVAFVAPWCGHCKRLKPEFAKAARTLAKDGIHIAKVDATESKALADRFQITGFPTLKFFRNGEPSEYNGGRDEAAIVSWVKKRAGPPAVRINSAAQAAEFEADNEVAVVVFMGADSEKEAAFFKTASSVDDVAFAMSDASSVLERYEADESTTAVLIAKFDGEELRSKYTGSLTNGKEFKAWISANSLPDVVTFSQESAPRIFRGEQKRHFLLFADKTSAGPQGDAYRAFRDAAKTNKNRALFVIVPPAEDKVMGYFGITEDQLPTAVLVHMADAGGMKKFKYTDAYTTEALQSFLDAYEAGKLKPFLKSDPAPSEEENAKAAVKVIVGTTFEKIALDPTKDVLLEVYAPWCGHCKQLEPIYKKLGEAFQSRNVETMVIAKMDGTSNEIDMEGVNVRGFPSIFFFPASKNGASAKKVVEFDGGRDLEGFVTFLQNHASHAFELDPEEVNDEL